MEPRFSPHSSGKKVAVVGSGPAGLTVADQLNHRGHCATVIEKRQQPGGILMYGIPNMKLPKSVVRRRIELMTREGVSFVTGLNAADPAVAKRLTEEYDAVVLCCGAEKPRPLGIETEGVRGVYFAMDFLSAAVERQQMSLSPAIPSAKGKNVVIIGTGNTASDCAATSIRQGCKSLVQLVRRPMEDYISSDGVLPQDYAQEEAEALFGHDPRLFSQSLASLETDEAGRLKAVVTKDGTRLPCELLIAATGFAGCREDICAAFGVALDRTVKTEAGSFRTSVPHVFTAGDMHRGQSLVVYAIAEGRACAAEVDRCLMGYTNLI
jgi:glutamate synthase (NADPH/NADH) small chain